ncbi:MAG: glycoside hydrolase family 97 protein [Bacteroidales bacterium]|nr:glycoside hydrolase family 97 protein [Bacteroidales bacterium]
MHRLYILLVGLFISCAITAEAHNLSSPDGNLNLEFALDAQGQPVYRLLYKSKSVIEQSRLGLLFDETSMTDGFTIKDVSISEFDEVWNPVWGEYAQIRNHYNEMAVELVQSGTRQRTMTLRFRLFNDGLGFRYEFPEQRFLNYLTVKDELTEFNLTGDHTFYCIPGDYDTNEFAYTTAPISQIRKGMEINLRKKGYESKATSFSVQTPLQIKTTDGLYVNIHEAALVGYSAMLLNVDDVKFSLNAHLTPDKNGKKGFVQLPFATPWRTVIVSDDARDILASQLILNLNEPCAYDDVSWIKPMKFMGVWWEMFIGTGKTWAYSDKYNAKPGVTDYKALPPNGHHPANTAHVKEYIDFASENGIDAVLVEGWNEGWEDWGSYHKDRQFLFNKPYPDFDVEALQAYAASKGVKIIMHHETAANASDYELQMDDAFSYMNEHGYSAVKTGYVGYVIPRSEYHSSQWMNNHYIEVARRAARYHIMIDSHEAVRPTGLCRTYPNWMAQESARGGEFESMGGNDPDHTAILPFTRLKGGPMDYTPGILQTQLSYYNGEKNDQFVHTTLAKQLALYLTMPSPIQMAADLPENYRRFNDAFQFIREVPVDWSDSKYLEAEPGDYITVARKDKNSDRWYVGAITDENERTAIIKFDFLPAGKKYEATIYEDAKDAHYQTNPMSYNIRKIKVTSKTVLKQRLASSGGAAISIREL